MDGTLYEFIKREHLPSDKMQITDESLQGDKYHRTDVDLTEPCYTQSFCKIDISSSFTVNFGVRIYLITKK